MNQFFNFERFTLLVSKHWADNKKRYVLSVMAFVGLLITWFVFTILTDFDDVPMGKEIQTATFFVLLFVVGSFYASQYFNDLGSKSKGLNFLLVPASAFEKFLCSLLYSAVFFFVAFTTFYYGVNVLMVGIANALPGMVQPEANVTVANVFDIIVLPVSYDTSFNLLLIFFSVQSAFLLGSVYFEKYSFIKTIITGFIVVFFIFCLVYFFYQHLLPSGYYTGGFLTSYRVQVQGGNDRLVQLPHWIGQVFRFLIMYGIAPLLWTVTYYRLKEKQV